MKIEGLGILDGRARWTDCHRTTFVVILRGAIYARRAVKTVAGGGRYGSNADVDWSMKLGKGRAVVVVHVHVHMNLGLEEYMSPSEIHWWGEKITVWYIRAGEKAGAVGLAEQ